MRQVFVAQHPTEAHFVKGLLEADGIPAEMHGEGLFGVLEPPRLKPDWTLTIGENRTGVPCGSEAASSPGNSN